MSWIMDLIKPELSWVICPWICKKNAESDFVYTLATENVDQLVPNMVLNVCDCKIVKEFNY